MLLLNLFILLLKWTALYLSQCAIFVSTILSFLTFYYVKFVQKYNATGHLAVMASMFVVCITSYMWCVYLNLHSHLSHRFKRFYKSSNLRAVFYFKGYYIHQYWLGIKTDGPDYTRTHYGIFVCINKKYFKCFNDFSMEDMSCLQRKSSSALFLLSTRKVKKTK